MKPRNRRSALLSSALFVTLLASPSASAVDRIWNGSLDAGPHNWNLGSNWIGGIAPIIDADRADLRKDWTAVASINLSAPTTTYGILFNDSGASGDVVVTIGNGGTATNTLTLAGPTRPYIETASSFAISAVMVGTQGLGKGGSSTLLLSGVNTYSGTTTVLGGSLQIGSISTTNGTSVTGGATGVGDVTMANATTLQNLAGMTWLVPTLTLEGSITLNSGSRLRTTFGTLELGNGTRVMNVNGRFRAVTGGNTVTNEGTGEAQLEMNATAIQTGTTPVIQNGVLSLQSTVGTATNPALMSIHGSTAWNNASLIIGPNNMLILNNNSPFVFGSTASNSAPVTVEGYLNLAASVTNNKNIRAHSISGGGKIFASMLATSNSATLTLLGDNNDSTFSGVMANGPITGMLSFTKGGAGKQTLSGVNTYTGLTTVSAGTLALSGSGTLGNGAPLTMSGGTLDLGAGSATVGAVSITAAAAVGNVIHNGSLTGTSYAVSNTTGDAIVSANLLANGSAGLTKTGAGILTLSGANTYSGTTIVRTGVLDVGTINSGSLGAGGLVLSNNGILQGNGEFTRSFSNSLTPSDGQMSTNDGTTSSPGGFAARGGPLVIKFGNSTNQVQLNSGSFRFGNGMVFGSPNSDNKVIVMNPLSLGGSNRTFTVNQGAGGDSAELAGGISDPYNVTKTGNGLLILSAINSYTGNTIISAGTVRLASTGQLRFKLGATSGVTNSISGTGDVELEGGFIIDTTSADGLSTGSWTLVSTSATYGSTFNVVGFTDKGDGTWTKVNGTQLWTYDESAGSLSLAVGGSAFDTWATTKGLSGNDALPASDPDRDGNSNLLEFALNGDPASAASNGLMASLVQNSSAPSTEELTLIIAVRDGAVFSNGSATVDGITYTVEGSTGLAFPGSPVSSTGPSDTAPAATGLPSLAGSAWEYHTFKLDSSEGLGGKGFLRLKVVQP